VTQQIWDDPRAKGYRKIRAGNFCHSFTEFVYGDVRKPLLILLGAVGFVLLICVLECGGAAACARFGPVKGIAVRTALGALRGGWRFRC